MLPSIPTSWLASVKSGSSVAAASAKFTTSGALELPVDLLRPPDGVEVELELLPHAARVSAATIAPQMRVRGRRALCALVRFMLPPLVVHIGRVAVMSNISLLPATVKRRLSQARPAGLDTCRNALASGRLTMSASMARFRID